jgi:hypothetical protein
MSAGLCAIAIALALTETTGTTGTTGTPDTSAPNGAFEHRVLATSRTSTMEKEMNEAAEAGYRFGGVMGGETSFGGSEVVVVMSRNDRREARFEYRLLATSKTSTMQRELQHAGDAGFEYRGQTAFETAFSGKEVVVILERDREAPRVHYEYRLLATKRTGTLQKELAAAGADGFEFVGLTVAETRNAGPEVIAILRRDVTDGIPSQRR